MTFIRSFFSDETGATAVEYGLVAVLIGVTLMTAISAFGTNLGALFNMVSDKIGVAIP